MSPDAVGAWLDLFLAVAAAVTVVVGVFRWFNRSLERKIVEEIREATRPIQPLTNGGLSLTDLHKKVDAVASEQQVIKAEVAALRGEVLVLESDVAAVEQIVGDK